MYSNTKTTIEKLRATNALIRKEEKARRKYLQNEEKIDICNSLESEISDKLKLLSRLPEKMKIKAIIPCLLSKPHYFCAT